MGDMNSNDNNNKNNVNSNSNSNENSNVADPLNHQRQTHPLLLSPQKSNNNSTKDMMIITTTNAETFIDDDDDLLDNDNDDDDDSLGLDLETDEEVVSQGTSSQSENIEQKTLKSQTRKTSVLRCLFITTLLTTCALVSNIALIIAINKQQDDYAQEYKQLSERVVQQYITAIGQMVSAADGLASQTSLQTITTTTTTMQQQPQQGINSTTNLDNIHRRMSIPNFELQAEGFRRLSSSTLVTYSPILHGKVERVLWEDYAASTFDATERSTAVSPDDLYIPHYGKYHNNNDDNAGATTGTLVTYRDIGNRTVQDGIYKFQRDGTPITDDDYDNDNDHYAPIWQVAPFSEDTQSTVMYNQMAEERRRSAISFMADTKSFVFSDLFYHSSSDDDNKNKNVLHDSYGAPLLNLYYPVFAVSDNNNNNNNDDDLEEVVGVLGLETGVEFLFENSLVGYPGEDLTVVIESQCDNSLSNNGGGNGGNGGVLTTTTSQYSFLVTAEQGITFVGVGDIHDAVPSVGDRLKDLTTVTFAQFEDIVTSPKSIYPTPQIEPICKYQIRIYPTLSLYTINITNRPILVQAGVGLVFLFTIAAFLAYDCMVERRQRRMLQEAQRSNAIVSSLFPKGVRDRLYKQAAEGEQISTSGMKAQDTAPKQRLKSFITTDSIMVSSDRTRDGTTTTNRQQAEPIADLFPSATVLFADVSGFTAWSSEREPSQVFVLLETLYGGIDNIARRLHVFKVETVGDCYVAATGIPEARDDHAIVMVRFANAMLKRVNELTTALESTLGPGTADLCMRVGIHSGPVTAGVLRGEKSRFQLFGDTMNTASRMESTSLSNHIQLSNDTANLLAEAGKGHWFIPREDLVAAKGKGKMQTYWLVQERQQQNAKNNGANNSKNNNNRLSIAMASARDMKKVAAAVLADSDEVELDDRLIDWIVQVMMTLIEKAAARRGKRRSSKLHFHHHNDGNGSSSSTGSSSYSACKGTILQEVTEVIALQKFDANAIENSDEHVVIPATVRSELRDYVAQIAASYNNNPFHNFQHASHVCLSAHKLLKRITRPDEVNYEHRKIDVFYSLHQHTYGISTDPLAQLAMVFCALIHDAGHTGVPNAQLAKEFPAIASKYEYRSIAEQRSIDISWELLMAPCYSNLRAFMFPTKEEQARFRQLIVNTVMATDIFDKEQATIRKARWAKAFGPEQPEWTDRDTMDRKATVVLEHVMQASDVAHTMQHWHVYVKWNENLFQEMYKAYAKGRAEKDPSEGWYKGELWFFDNYVIPLARKLKECGVFGVSSDEYLNYALENRAEWEQKGESIVKRMHETMIQQIESETMSNPRDDKPEEDLPPNSIQIPMATRTTESTTGSE